jgi:hypothetical protein
MPQGDVDSFTALAWLQLSGGAVDWGWGGLLLLEQQEWREAQSDNLQTRRNLVGTEAEARRREDLERLFVDAQKHLKTVSQEFSAARRRLWRRVVALRALPGARAFDDARILCSGRTRRSKLSSTASTRG